MIWFIMGFSLGFYLAFNLGRLVYNKKMEEILAQVKELEKLLRRAAQR